MHVTSFPSPEPCYSDGQYRLGLCGLSLLSAIKLIPRDRELAIAILQKEVQILSQFPEPEMRHICDVAMSFLGDMDYCNLRSIAEDVEMAVLWGEPQAQAA